MTDEASQSMAQQLAILTDSELDLRTVLGLRICEVVLPRI